jgi:hypothetical protein
MSTIAAGNTTSTAVVITGDTTGNLAFTTGAGANTITVPNETGTIITNKTAGTILQVVQGTSNTTVTTASTSYVTTGLSASITPKFITSKVLVVVSAAMDSRASGQQIFYTVYRGATDLAGTSTGFGAVFDSAGRLMAQAVVSFLDSPARTNSTTYTLYFLTNTGTVAYSNNGSLGTIQLLEVSA